jgi:hypothetical protein
MAPVWIGVGVAVAGTATAILFAVFKGQANSSDTNLQNEITSTAKGMGVPTKDLCNNPPSAFTVACQSLQSDQNQVNSDATVANVAVGVAIAGAAFSVGWYLFAPKRDAKDSTPSPTGLSPILGPHMNGLSYTGSF